MLKKPLGYCDQVKRLKEHGMIVEDDKYAEIILSTNNYYRFTGYALEYRKSPDNSDYNSGTTFDGVYEIYRFDADLRQLLRRYLEIAEIYYRTVISHEFSLAKCRTEPHDQHYDECNYYNKVGFAAILENFKKEKSYYKDSLIMKHHNKKYAGKMPLWVMVEMMSMSDVSKLFSCMYISEQERIANAVGCGVKTLKNHIHCISVLRNKCAHAARLYNTTFYPSAEMSTAFLRKYTEVRNDSLFAYIIALTKRLPEKKTKECLVAELSELLDEYADSIQIKKMGFPDNWEIVLKNQIT